MFVAGPIIGLLLTGAIDRAEGAELTVVATGLRSDAGFANFVLFNSAEGFPSDPKRAHGLGRTRIQGGRAEFRFSDLPPGEYAVSFTHDEDGDGRVGTNLIGVPTEGVGCSNNPKVRLGPYSFEDGRFSLGSSPATITIKAWYL